jgi:hypothetical protein
MDTGRVSCQAELGLGHPRDFWPKSIIQLTPHHTIKFKAWNIFGKKNLQGAKSLPSHSVLFDEFFR